MNAPNDLSFVIPIIEAANLQTFRRKYLHRPAVSMPSHITVPSPFESFQDLGQTTHTHLRATFTAFQPFQLVLSTIHRFRQPGVLYLVPEPISPLLQLHHAICDTVSRSYSPSPVFHLTLAGWYAEPELDQIQAEFVQAYGDRLPIEVNASEVWLYEQVEGKWLKREAFKLGWSR